MKTRVIVANSVALFMCYATLGSNPALAQFPRFPKRGSQQSQAQQAATQQAPAPVPVAPLGPKQPGKIRIGVATPKADMGQGFTGVDAAEPIRNTLIASLSGPAIEVTPLTSRIQQQIDLEAKQKQCDFILYSSLTEKHGGGGFGSMLSKAAPMASMIPMVGMAGGMAGAMAGAMAGQVASTAIMTASSLSSGVKAKDEVTFEFKLMSPDNATAALTNVGKAKATKNGEDVITPLLAQAATAVVTEATKEKK